MGRGLRQEIVARWGHGLAHFFARVSEATLICVCEAVMVGHAGARPAAFHHFGELLGCEMRCAQRKGIAAITLVARRIPFMAILAHRLALEDFLAELDQASFFRGRRRLSDGWPHIIRKPEEASCGSNQRRAAACALSCRFQDGADHSKTPDMACASFAFEARLQMSSEISVRRTGPDLKYLFQLSRRRV